MFNSKNIKFSEAYKRLLGEDQNSEDTEYELSKKRSNKRQYIIFALLQAGFLLLYTVAFTYALHRSRLHLESGMTWSPARPAIEYSMSRLDFSHRPESESPYTGPPSIELDAAWNELIKYQNIRYTEDEMRHMDRLHEGILLPDERGGYLGTINVFHEIHCLKRIHHYMYEDHYFPNLTEQEKGLNRMHNSHCIDVLRQAIMCHGDITPLTSRWGKKQSLPIGNSTAPHECVNWDSLVGWAKERNVDVFAKGMLMHPIYGDALADKHAAHLGVALDE